MGAARPQTGNGAVGAGAAVVGTPDDLIAAIRTSPADTGGFGVVLGFAHDWANREATMRSWDLVARYVIPEITGDDSANMRASSVPDENQTALMAGAAGP